MVYTVNEAVKAACDRLEGRAESMLDTVIRWSHINSGSRNLEGLAVMEQEIITAFSDLGGELERVQLADTETVHPDGSVETVKNGVSLRFFKRPTANRRLLMTGHYDTVFATSHPFQKTQWLNDTTLNGPGVADMKGGILVMLEALRAFEATGLADSIGWEVILSPDEETGSLASAPLLAMRAREAHIGLTYEPALADGTLAGERKGSGNYTVTVRGKAAHAGREFHAGRNAVVHLSKIVGELAALTGTREGLTVNPATLTGGVAPNVVPDVAQCRFNVRLAKPEDAAWFEAQVAAIISAANKADGFTVHLHGGINRPPKAITPTNQMLMDIVADCGAQLGLRVSYVPTGGCCEGNNLAAAGLPNVDTLGVRGGDIHSADEFLCTDSLVERAQLSLLIFSAFAAGALDSVIEAR